MRNTLIFLSIYIIAFCTISCNQKYNSDFDFVGKWKGEEVNEFYQDSLYFVPSSFSLTLKMYADGKGVYNHNDNKLNFYWKYDDAEQQMLLFIENKSAVERGAPYPFTPLRFNIIQNSTNSQIWRRSYYYTLPTGEKRQVNVEWNLTK